VDGETDVAVTRETIVRLSAPLSTNAVLKTNNLYASSLGRRLLSRGGSAYARTVLGVGVRDLTGGATGIAGVPSFSIGGLRVTSDAGSFWLVWIVFAVLFWLAWGIVHSPVGYALRAIKQDELAAAANGINVFRYKTIAFLLAAGYASVAGSLFAHQLRFIAPDTVNWVVSTSLVTMLVLGGEGTLWGVLPGAFLLRLVPEIFNALQDYLLIVQGVVLVAVMIYLPRGLAGIFLGRWRRAA